MSILTYLVLGFGQEAHAGSPYYQPVSLSGFSEWNMSDYMGSVDSVVIDEAANGIAEIPLYSDASGKPKLQTYVRTENTEEGSMGDMMDLVPESSLIVVSEGFVKANKLETRTTNKRLIPVPSDYKTGGEVKYVTIPQLQVGAITLTNVTALVGGSEVKGIDSTGKFSYKQPSIGLGALPVSYAIVESEGLIRVTAKDNASQLLEKVSSADAITIPYTETPWLIGRVGARSLTGATQQILPAMSLIADASFGGSSDTVQTLFNFGVTDSTLDKYHPATATISQYYGDVRQDLLDVSVGGKMVANASIERLGMMDIDGTFPMAMLGSNVLAQYDVVVDKTAKTITLVKNAGQKRLSSWENELAVAKKALEPKENTEKVTEDKEKTEKTEESAESTEPSGPDMGAVNNVIKVLEKGGKYQETLEYYTMVLADAEEKTDCELWLNYGHTQRKLGDFATARSAYVQSAELYHSWWDMEIGQRMDINKAQDKMKKEDKDIAKEKSKDAPVNSVTDGWYISQPSGCYVAEGYIGYLDMINGKFEDVQSNYRTNMDLDVNLARAFGNASLIQGDTATAHEAYRQAIRFEDGAYDRSLNRLGLAIVYADQGKWEQADGLFREAMELSGDILTVQIWMDNAKNVLGREAAEKQLMDWIASHPNHAAAHIALLREYTLRLFTLGTQLTKLEEEAAKLAAEKAQAAQNAPTKGKKATEPTPPDAQESASNQLQAQIEEIKGQQQQLGAQREKAFQSAGVLQNLSFVYRNDPKMLTALQAQTAVFTGNLAGAQAIIDAAPIRTADLVLTQANILALQGNIDDAFRMLDNAVPLHPGHAGYALFLQ